jgi:hypothetical protein
LEITNNKSFKSLQCSVYLPVYNNEKENWRILTNKEIYAMVKKPTIMETIMLHRSRWFGHVQRMEENRIPQKILYI